MEGNCNPFGWEKFHLPVPSATFWCLKEGERERGREGARLRVWWRGGNKKKLPGLLKLGSTQCMCVVVVVRSTLCMLYGMCRVRGRVSPSHWGRSHRGQQVPLLTRGRPNRCLIDINHLDGPLKSYDGRGEALEPFWRVNCVEVLKEWNVCITKRLV